MNDNKLLKAVQISTVFSCIKKLIPDDVLITCSEWAEKYRFLTKKLTNKPGPFSFDNAPWAKEVVDCASKNSPVREVAVMKGVQLGFTMSVMENIVGYTIGSNPTPAMFVFPTDDLCKEYKALKIDNLIDNSGLRSHIKAETENRNTRRKGDTAFLIEFLGGFLKLASANKATALRSLPIQILLLDEVDGYPDELKNEGSPIDIAKKRTDSYSNVRKIFYGSTPTKQHKSKIKELYEKGDKRKFYVPCPFCGEMQELVFYVSDGGEYPNEKGIKKNKTVQKPYGIIFNAEECKDGNYSSVAYKCKHCGEEIKEYHKKDMLLKGDWRATAKSKHPHYRSYHISALYSLTKSWEEIVFDFIDAGKNAKKLQTFYNLDLGLPFEDLTGGVEYQQVHRLKDDTMPNNFVPKEAFFLTAAADVQRDRIEVEIKAWGDRFRCWGIDHRVFYGNIKDIYDPCWQKLADIEKEIFTDGRTIEIMLVDSGDGENTDTVYSFCSLYGNYHIFPLKGFSSTVRTKTKYKIVELQEYGGLSLIEVYVDIYKNMLAKYFVQEESPNDILPDGWFTFAQNYSGEYFRQLTTERKTKVKLANGYTYIKWEQHGRNEAFDLNVYNLAAFDLVIYQYSVAVLNLENADARAVFKYFNSIKK